MDTSDFRNGISMILDNDLFTLIEFQHVKPGKGGAFVRSKLRNIRTGAVIDKTFRAGEKMDQAYLERKPMNFIFQQDEDYFLMDMESFEQTPVKREQIGDSVKYLQDNLEVTVLLYNGAILSVELPMAIEAEVVETASSERGNTASGGSKPATLETGAVVQVPFFVNAGDKIKVDTRTDSYIERVK